LFKSDLSIGSGETRTSNKPEESENDVGYPHSMGMERQGAKFQTARTGRTGKDVADTSSKRLERRKETILKEERWHSCTGYDKKKIGSSWRNSQWDSEPDVGRVANGVPSRVDRLKCLGNSIVPQIAELIFSQAVFDKYRLVHEKEVDNVSE
jgi:DNA (cytosine-5)-methyltransferase 1